MNERVIVSELDYNTASIELLNSPGWKELNALPISKLF